MSLMSFTEGKTTHELGDLASRGAQFLRDLGTGEFYRALDEATRKGGNMID